jgi:hypothetical protein
MLGGVVDEVIKGSFCLGWGYHDCWRDTWRVYDLEIKEGDIREVFQRWHFGNFAGSCKDMVAALWKGYGKRRANPTIAAASDEYWLHHSMRVRRWSKNSRNNTERRGFKSWERMIEKSR